MGWPQMGFDRNDDAQAGFDQGTWDIRLDARALSTSTASGLLTQAKRLYGVAVSAPQVAGSLSVPKPLAGAAAGQALGAGALSAPKRLTGHGNVLFAGSGRLAAPKVLAGAAADAALSAGTLSAPKRLAAMTAGSSSLCAALRVPKGLRGRAVMRDDAAAGLAHVAWPAEVDAYVRLITAQHATRPRFVAAVKTLAALAVDVQRCLRAVGAAFDVDTAVGVQLDQVGQWVGISRVLRVPLTGVYFAFDEAGVGFDEGVWRGDYDPDSGLVSLPDDQYRTLIYARIAANGWDGTIPGAYAIWASIFPGSHIIIQDWQNMSMTVGIARLPLNAVLRSLLTGGYIPLKPQGVRVDYYAVGTEAGPLLAFDAESEALAGWDAGQWPVELQPQHNGVIYAP